MQHYKTKQNIVNSKTKQKSKTILGVVRNLVLDFILYFVTAYIIHMRKYPKHVTRTRVKHKIHYASLEEVSKNKFMTNNLQQ